MAALLDVNALIALVDTDHLSHSEMSKWFLAHYAQGWATCPLTENGMIRVLSQPAYASGQRTPVEAVQILTSLKATFRSSYEFWPNEISLTDAEIFKPELIAGPRQVTDVYLPGLAARRNSVLVSFDKSLPWHAVKGGSPKLIERPA